MPGEHELRIALATALRELDEARHGLDEWCKAAMQERAHASASEEALAAARGECEGLRKQMTELAGALSEAADDIDSRDVEGFREALREGATAITDALAGLAQ